MSDHAHRFIATQDEKVVAVIELLDPWRSDLMFVADVQRFLNKHFRQGASIQMERIQKWRPDGLKPRSPTHTTR